MNLINIVFVSISFVFHNEPSVNKLIQTKDTTYTITIEGKYFFKKIKIFADDTLVFNKHITHEKNEVIIKAAQVKLQHVPKHLKIFIGKEECDFNCNAIKSYLYIEQFDKEYKLEDFNIRRRYD